MFFFYDNTVKPIKWYVEICSSKIKGGSKDLDVRSEWIKEYVVYDKESIVLSIEKKWII